jgi:iron complex outermembrane receptor protein
VGVTVLFQRSPSYSVQPCLIRPFRIFLALMLLVSLAFQALAEVEAQHPLASGRTAVGPTDEDVPVWVASSSWPLSEQDYLEPQLPVVLTVSRLPQRVDEAPGAVTVIDRDTIRASGARDVADLLRLVPGFFVSNSFEEGASAGSYHGLRSTFPNRMQLLVDGRSVYSLHLGGSVGPGLQTVALDDIERIEIFRGPNSASYGARAFLGSINIITRDLVDTQGVTMRLTQGAGRDGAGVDDWGVQLGGVAGGDAAAGPGRLNGAGFTGWRLSADRRLDEGLQGAGGSVEVQRVNGRVDANLSDRDQLSLRAGLSQIESWIGNHYDFGSHKRQLATSYAQVDWNRNLDENADLSVQLSHTQEQVQEQTRGILEYPLPGYDGEGVLYDRSGVTRSTNLLVQHTWRFSPTLRWVWGGELRRETSDSYALYATRQPYAENFVRYFGNAEWHFATDWLLNAGALVEYSSMTEEYETAPRLMLNWNVGQTGAARHTLRGGVSRAFRPASMFERKADVRYYDPQTGSEIGYEYDAALGHPSRPERVDSTEFGWLVDAGTALSFDLRLFQERVQDVIMDQRVAAKTGGQFSSGTRVVTYVNGPAYDVQGAEVQLLWRPWHGGQLRYTHTQFTTDQRITLRLNNPTSGVSVPDHTSHSLFFAQRLPGGWSFSVWDYYMGERVYPNSSRSIAAPYNRVDARLAKILNLGAATGPGRQAELALTVQSMGGAEPDDVADISFQRRVYVTLQVGY